jgi:hypothetical protein
MLTQWYDMGPIIGVILLGMTMILTLAVSPLTAASPTCPPVWAPSLNKPSR